MGKEDDRAKASGSSELDVQGLVEAAWSDAGLGGIGRPRARIIDLPNDRRALAIGTEIGGRRYIHGAQVWEDEPSSPHQPAITLLLRCIVRDAARHGVPTDGLAPWVVALVDRKTLVSQPTTADLADMRAGRTANRERADVLAYVAREISSTAWNLESRAALTLLYASVKAGRHEGAAEEER